MNWYRIGCQAVYDARWNIIAKRAGLSRGSVLGLFLLLLDFAAGAKPKGSLAGFDVEAAALWLGTGAGRLHIALREMRAREIVTQKETLGTWHFPSSSTQRVRAWRSRRRGDTDAETDAAARRARLSPLRLPPRQQPQPSRRGR